ncbi:MAG: hypothetical protein RIQ56_788 [Candidatus Parcubacteria bacterium]|jgi:pyruvate,water dikinase
MYTISLTEARVADTSRVGAKAATLGEIASRGYSVPNGFVILPLSWEEMHLTKAVVEISERASLLRGERFAVRSSAVVEDGATAAWAGQFMTLLDVERGALVEAARQISHSHTLERAKVYGEAVGVQQNAVIPVIVQELLAPEKAGVCFTAHPVSGDVAVGVIEAVTGRGENLVDGTQTPDTYEVRKDSLDAKVVNRAMASATDVLESEEVKLIMRIAKELEDYLGHPQDVEWALKDGVCWVLQSRPVTTL